MNNDIKGKIKSLLCRKYKLGKKTPDGHQEYPNSDHGESSRACYNDSSDTQLKQNHHHQQQQCEPQQNHIEHTQQIEQRHLQMEQQEEQNKYKELQQNPQQQQQHDILQQALGHQTKRIENHKSEDKTIFYETIDTDPIKDKNDDVTSIIISSNNPLQATTLTSVSSIPPIITSEHQTMPITEINMIKQSDNSVPVCASTLTSVSSVPPLEHQTTPITEINMIKQSDNSVPVCAATLTSVSSIPPNMTSEHQTTPITQMNVIKQSDNSVSVCASTLTSVSSVPPIMTSEHQTTPITEMNVIKQSDNSVPVCAATLTSVSSVPPIMTSEHQTTPIIQMNMMKQNDNSVLVCASTLTSVSSVPPIMTSEHQTTPITEINMIEQSDNSVPVCASILISVSSVPPIMISEHQTTPITEINMIKQSDNSVPVCASTLTSVSSVTPIMTSEHLTAPITEINMIKQSDNSVPVCASTLTTVSPEHQITPNICFNDLSMLNNEPICGSESETKTNLDIIQKENIIIQQVTNERQEKSHLDEKSANENTRILDTQNYNIIQVGENSEQLKEASLTCEYKNTVQVQVDAESSENDNGGRILCSSNYVPTHISTTIFTNNTERSNSDNFWEGMGMDYSGSMEIEVGEGYGSVHSRDEWSEGRRFKSRSSSSVDKGEAVLLDSDDDMMDGDYGDNDDINDEEERGESDQQKDRMEALLRGKSTTQALITTAGPDGLMDVYELQKDLDQGNSQLNIEFDEYRENERSIKRLCDDITSLKREIAHVHELNDQARSKIEALQGEHSIQRSSLAAVCESKEKTNKSDMQLQQLEFKCYRDYYSMKNEKEADALLDTIRDKMTSLINLETLVQRKRLILKHSLPVTLKEAPTMKIPVAKKTRRLLDFSKNGLANGGAAITRPEVSVAPDVNPVVVEILSCLADSGTTTISVPPPTPAQPQGPPQGPLQGPGITRVIVAGPQATGLSPLSSESEDVGIFARALQQHQGTSVD